MTNFGTADTQINQFTIRQRTEGVDGAAVFPPILVFADDVHLVHLLQLRAQLLPAPVSITKVGITFTSDQ